MNSTPTRQPIAETGKSPLIEDLPKKEEQVKRQEGFLNPRFPLKDRTIIDFLMEYQCNQMEKTYLKEIAGFDHLDTIGTDLQVAINPESQKLTKRVNELIETYKKATDRRPFSKAHLALSAAISKIASE